ncbi:ATP-dependent protease LonB [Candidatus Epulonipiscioides gigas]|nr:ATP-dependent protease LonB [Epulopiscium sp. SCG-C07WGA-EpuloA2]
MEYFITGTQLFFSTIIGIYFMTQLINNRTSKCVVHEGEDTKFQELQQLRKVYLKEPLTEKMRPKTEKDIIGQDDALLALKAALCSKNPQHVIIYGSPGVGKTAASRIALDIAKSQPESSFSKDAKFIEIDATTLRFDERSVADPLMGSVHDPIYQGAGTYGSSGVPNPKPGAVTKAHGGVLFIDEIGELHSIQMNKLLKVLEDRKVHFDSVYYNEKDKNIPRHIHDIFQNGLPADFRLIGATTRDKNEIPPALRTRCVEISFKDLQHCHLKEIIRQTVKRELIKIEDETIEKIAWHANNGRDAISILQMAINKSALSKNDIVTNKDVEWVIKSGGYMSLKPKKVTGNMNIGKINGLYVSGQGTGGVSSIHCVAKKVSKGLGDIKITGIVEEEELRQSHSSIKRKSMVKSSLDNVLTVFKAKFNIPIEDYYIHITFPSGAPTDGPSAGIAMFCVLYSAIFNEPINSNIALTGEITIHGEVYPVGGISQKIQASIEAGIKKIFIPQENMSEMYIDYDIEVCPVNNINEIIEDIFTASIIRKAN